jgi:hypothetical protein
LPSLELYLPLLYLTIKEPKVKEKNISNNSEKIAISLQKDNNENYYNIKKKKKPVLRSVVHDQQA